MRFQEQAESCRRQANHYAGRPEAPFLLSVARAFDELATSPVARPDRRETEDCDSAVPA